jgi:hypothetical protein
MILTTSMEWSDRPSPNCHLGYAIKKTGPEPRRRRRGGKAVPFSAPLFDPKPLVASYRRHGPDIKMTKRTFDDVLHLRAKRSLP